MDSEFLFTELRRHLESQIPGHQPESPPTLSPGELAGRLFARQLQLNPAFQRLMGGSSAGHPEAIHDLQDIPDVPVAAFKERNLELTSVAANERVAVFHSSGTTDRQPSRHFHSEDTLALYRVAIEGWFKRHLLMDQGWADSRRRPQVDERLPFISLTPDATEAPHSSLVFMLDAVSAWYGSPDSRFVGKVGTDGWEVDLDRLRTVLTELERKGRPVVLMGTAFSFVHVLEDLERRQWRFFLPAGSRVMETGGYKGRSRTVPKAELHALIAERFGILRSHIISEYGMSELSSQAYDSAIGSSATDSRIFHFPPWCRVTLISPETGRVVKEEGEVGLLRVHDLANVASVLAIQTEDLAVRVGDGFELRGRAAISEPRGCSLMPAE